MDLTKKRRDKNKLNFFVDGEFQLDTALIPDVCRKKCIPDEIVGDANVLIFPNLDAGNIGYKLVERLASYRALGPCFQGFSKPLNDLSRGCSRDDIRDVISVTSILANSKLSKS